jgi:hypothetical protein
MTHKEFEQAYGQLSDFSRSLLFRKSAEYSTEADKLHNFKQAAELQGVSNKKALGGMMAKHTISVYDMINSNKPQPTELWREKLADSINYLYLLWALVCEEEGISFVTVDNGDGTFIRVHKPEDV